LTKGCKYVIFKEVEGLTTSNEQEREDV